jgi:DNA-binding HxlR family transcriptional regulator
MNLDSRHLRSSAESEAFIERFKHDSVGRTLDLVGERWTILLLCEAYFGVRRYAQFAKNLQIPRPTLSNRLAKLVEAGLLERVRYGGGPVRDEYEYRLTKASRDLFPAIISLMKWGDTYLARPEGTAVTLIHTTCGMSTQPNLTCDQCSQEVTIRNVQPAPGPAFFYGQNLGNSQERSIPDAE